MKLNQLFKMGLAVLFACTISFASIGCEQGGSEPAAPADGGGEAEDGGGEAPAPEGGEEGGSVAP